MASAAHDPAEVFSLFARVGIVPVVTVDDPGVAVPLAAALVEGDLPVLEITLRSPTALDAIEALAAEGGPVLLGAGTVLRAEQARRAIACGARFLVSPGLHPSVVDVAQEANVAVLPGIATPTEIAAALELGLSTLKFFPAESFGGTATLKALSAPYAGVRFVPTGGIGESNYLDYLSLPSVLAVGGSWIVPTKALRAGRYDEITAAVRTARNAVDRLRGNAAAQ